jgi:hypothetical protein
MEKIITIGYSTYEHAQQVLIPVSYEKEDDDNIQTIRCKISLPQNEIPAWLKPHKFEIRAMYNGNSYQVLLNETRGVHTLDAILFMEKAQEALFLAEKRMAAKIK